MHRYKIVLPNRKMSDRFNFKAELSNKSSKVETELALISFQEDDVFFVYCPALDLTGYGYNENEAKESFSQTLKMYLEYTTNENTLSKDLELHGWEKSNRKFKSLDFDFLFRHNEQLKNIVNNRDFSKYKEQIQFPECVYA